MDNTALSKFGDIFSGKKTENKNTEEKIKEEVEKERKKFIEEAEKKALETLEKEKNKLREEIREEMKMEILPAEEEKQNNYQANLSLIEDEWKEKLSYFDEITKDEDTAKYLKSKSAEILLTGSVYSLKLGEIAEEVFQKLGKQGSKDGLYLKWAKFNGFSESTLKRYRNHWIVYNSVKDGVKPLIKMLNQKQIQCILKDETVKELVYQTSEMSMEDLKGILSGIYIEDTQEKNEDKDKKEDKEKEENLFAPKALPEFNLKKLSDMYNKIEELEEKKRNKFLQLIKELNKLLED